MIPSLRLVGYRLHLLTRLGEVSIAQPVQHLIDRIGRLCHLLGEYQVSVGLVTEELGNGVPQPDDVVNGGDVARLPRGIIAERTAVAVDLPAGLPIAAEAHQRTVGRHTQVKDPALYALLLRSLPGLLQS